MVTMEPTTSVDSPRNHVDTLQNPPVPQARVPVGPMLFGSV